MIKRPQRFETKYTCASRDGTEMRAIFHKSPEPSSNPNYHIVSFEMYYAASQMQMDVMLPRESAEKLRDFLNQFLET